ncbi:MAG: sulfatase-like hydrolase/transferase [Pirellulales bacterium]
MSRWSNRFAIGVLVVSAWVTAPISLVAAADSAADSVRPNIIVIVGDDMGYSDLGVQGGGEIPTPRLDALARSGIRFTNGYVSGPYCSPTRAGLMTGRYQQRFGHEFNPGPPVDTNTQSGLPLTEKTLADHLHQAGYRTALVGKWHLGGSPKHHPLERGFDEFFGFLGGAHPYLPAGDGARAKAAQRNSIMRGRELIDEKEYLTDAFAREATAFVDRQGEQPYFLYLAFNAVHTPMQATDKYLARFESIKEGNRRAYAAMLSAMDDAVGRVLDKVREKKQEERTLIVFFSDNGGPPVNASNNLPLRGHKASTWEGGVRVPFFVSWKGKLPAGKTYDSPVIQLDVLPTALAAAGITPPENSRWDGVNLLPFLTGEKTETPHEHLYWRFGEQWAVRSGSWKLVQAKGSDAPMLIDLAHDIGETTDRSASETAVRERLATAWKSWNSELEEPRWKANRAAGKNGTQKAKKAQAKKAKAN